MPANQLKFASINEYNLINVQDNWVCQSVKVFKANELLICSTAERINYKYQNLLKRVLKIYIYIF